MSKKEPERKCVVCGKSAQKRELLRFALADEKIFKLESLANECSMYLDIFKCGKGRGFYVHASSSCAGSRHLSGRLLGAMKRVSRLDVQSFAKRDFSLKETVLNMKSLLSNQEMGFDKTVRSDNINNLKDQFISSCSSIVARSLICPRRVMRDDFLKISDQYKMVMQLVDDIEKRSEIKSQNKFVSIDAKVRL